MKKKQRFWVLGLVLLVAAVFAGSFGGSSYGFAATEEPPPTLTVQGTGEVQCTPDAAQVTLGIVTMKKTAREAQKENAVVTDRVIKGLLAQGIPQKDIQTVSYSIWPEYSYDERGKEPPRLTGYRAENSLRVNLKDPKQVGIVVDTAVENGANQIQNISFGLQDDTSSKREALQKAVWDARAKAEAIASALGVKIIGIASAQEGYVAAPVIRASKAFMDVGGGELPPPVEPGMLSVSALVTVVFLLSPAP